MAEFNTSVSVVTNQMNTLITEDFKSNGVPYDEDNKRCGMNAVQAIFTVLKADGKTTINDIDSSNLRTIAGQAASLKLDACAFPPECYFQLRSKKVGNNYVKVVEMGIMGAGHEAILRNFGVDVKRVYPFWLVKEGDGFVYPKHKGIKVTDPEWEENGLSDKVARVVLPVELNDGTITYLISERASVKTNLFAHVRNNLMNETFGIAESRYKANDKQLKQINDKKQEIFTALSACDTVDDMLACEIALPYISAAWKETSESMIIRKMQNNAVRRFPKSFTTLAKQSFTEMDESYQAAQEEIAEEENSVVIDVEAVDTFEAVVEEVEA